MSNSNSLKDFEKKLREIARQNQTPLYGGFELTSRCNFDCKMCYVHLPDSEKIRKKELSTTEVLDIIEKACNAGMLYATLSGGECLLRKDFEEIYMFLIRHGVKVILKTNGFLIRKFLPLFKIYPPYKISVSFYGSNEEVYEKVTGVRGFEVVKNALRSITELHIPLTVSVTPSRFCYEDVPNIVAFLNQNHYKYIISPFLIPPRGEIERDEYYLTPEEQLQMFVSIRKQLGKALYDNDTDRLPHPGGNASNSPSGIECSAGSYRFNVTWDGFMVPCYCFDAPHIDIRQYGFSEAWRQLVENNQKVVQPVECVNCAYKKICIFCPFIRYSSPYTGHCNKDLCHFILEKVKRGIVKL